MNYGRLRCLGSQTRLKAKFGEGYQLKFHCRSGRIREVERYVQANVPSARHMETYAGEREGGRKKEGEREREGGRILFACGVAIAIFVFNFIFF